VQWRHPILEERMKAKRLVVLTAAVLTAAGGTGAALAVTRSDNAKQTEQAVLSDAAKRLNVSPSDLHDALAAAEDAQLDQLVKDGKLTQEQADAIKARRKESGLVLGFGPGGPPMFMHHGFAVRFELFDDIASAIGISRQQLFAQLRDGKSLADIAKAHGKSLDDVKSSVRAAVKKQLDPAVKEGKLTQAQEDDILSHVGDMIDHFGDRQPHGMHGPGPGPGMGFGFEDHGPGPGPAPGPDGDGPPNAGGAAS
jgi:polyhydroxyalkanoate synthesis regulator phasin